MGNKGQGVWRRVAPTSLSMGVAMVSAWVLMWAGSFQAHSAPAAPPVVAAEAPEPARPTEPQPGDTAREAEPWPGVVSDSGWLAMLLVSGGPPPCWTNSATEPCQGRCRGSGTGLAKRPYF